MKMFLSGNWVDSSNGQTIHVYNPATGVHIDDVPMATADEVEQAIAYAQVGKIAMRKLTANQRYVCLNKIAESIEAHAEELAVLLAMENAKPIQQTRAEVRVTANIFRGFGEETKRIFGRVYPLDAVRGNERHFGFTIRQPLGVVAAIVPFNYPVELWGHKAAAALAGGNALISKPPSECPLTLLRITELMLNSGLPAGAHQMITGRGSVVGEALARSAGVQMLTLTGSTQTGIRISELGAETLKKIHLELGGNDAMMVLGDADLEKAAEAVILGRLARGNGQICCAVKRVLVEDNIYDEFSALLSSKATLLKVGNPLDEDTDVGPLINEKAAIDVERMINQAVEAGAKLIIGGTRTGAYIHPTILEDITAEMEFFNVEVFGPVVPLVRFKTIEEAIALVNNSVFGLQAAVFTRDINKAFDIAYKLEAGGVIINWSSALRVETLPFGGIKFSGHGRESIHDTLEEMTELKTIVVHNAFSPIDD
jgi:acyl-CoA reductase-like NAD-dependent aldehyde dehydrogenase